MKNITQIAFFLIIIALAGFAGIWIGQNTLVSNDGVTDLHSIFHDELNVTKQQDEKLSLVEGEYGSMKDLYKGQMRVANLELAQAIKDGGYKSPEIEAIIHKIHVAMGELQNLSLEHLHDMQKILNAEQNKRLQEIVIEQLKQNAGE